MNTNIKDTNSMSSSQGNKNENRNGLSKLAESISKKRERSNNSTRKVKKTKIEVLEENEQHDEVIWIGTEIEVESEDNEMKQLSFENHQIRNALKDTIIKEAEQEQVRTKLRIKENNIRLARYSIREENGSCTKTLVDGKVFQDLFIKQNDIEFQKEELKEQKRQLRKERFEKINKVLKGKISNAAVSQLNFLDHYEEKLKMIKLQLDVLYNKIEMLELDRQKYEIELDLHIRELKLSDIEKKSRFKNYQVFEDRYLFLKLLGKGGFGEVYKAYDLKMLRYVACKVHIKYTKRALREYNIHKNLDHPNIVKLFDTFYIDENSFCTVMEYCEGNDLEMYLMRHYTISEEMTKSIVGQVISALKYMNDIKPSVIHYDLKPANILISKSDNGCCDIKISDFGLSKIVDVESYDANNEIDLTSQGAGTYWYLPPECFVVSDRPPKISSKVDVWSVGIILYECLYGETPFGSDQTKDSLLKNKTILNAVKVKFPNEPAVSTTLINVILSCLTHKKEDRIDIQSLANHEYFQ